MSLCLLSHYHVVVRVVKRSSDLRTSNFKLEFAFVFQPFDIQIQASLIRRRQFCLESGALLLQWCTMWWFLCSLPAVNSSDARRVFAYPSPFLPAYRRGVLLLSILHCAAPGASCILIQAIKVTNFAGPDTEQTSIDSNRVQHGLTSWLIALLIDCFLACGMSAVTFISSHSADIKRKLLKILHKYINKVRI